ncbi:MAG: Cro/CI family transcriptional regulator [Pseudomonadota bacterium]
MSAKEATSLAVKNAGGAIALAARLGVTRQAVHKWIAGSQIPANRVCDVEFISGVSRYDLRPDVFKRAEAVQREVTA